MCNNNFIEFLEAFYSQYILYFEHTFVLHCQFIKFINIIQFIIILLAIIPFYCNTNSYKIIIIYLLII